MLVSASSLRWISRPMRTFAPPGCKIRFVSSSGLDKKSIICLAPPSSNSGQNNRFVSPCMHRSAPIDSLATSSTALSGALIKIAISPNEAASP